MSLIEQRLFVKTTCSICCVGNYKPVTSCPYCDARGATLVEASTDIVIKILRTIPPKEQEQIIRALTK